MQKITRQGGSGTEPETGYVGTVFSGTEVGTGTVGATGTGTFCSTSIETEKSFSRDEPSEPKTGTARTVPFTNRNRTEPNRDHPDKGKLAIFFFIFSIFGLF